MFYKAIAIVGIFFVSGLWASWGPFKKSELEVNIAKITKKCASLPKQKSIEEDILYTLSIHLTWQNRLRIFFDREIKEQPRLARVSLDGYILENIRPFDLEVIMALTDVRAGRYLVTPKPQKFKSAQTLYIQRSCTEFSCTLLDGDKVKTLVRYNGAKPCSDALCASKDIFGSQEGPLILWAYLKYKTNLSPFSDVGADPKGLRLQDLKTILLALELVPYHLRSSTLKDSGFFRFKRGKTLKVYAGRGVIANARGALFDLFEESGFESNISTIIHELGHRAQSALKEASTDADGWNAVAGWEQIPGNVEPNPRSILLPSEEYRNPNTDGWITPYSRTNPGEDFAESFLHYRFNPKTLQEVSPQRFAYMRDRVFNGIDYSADPCAN